MKKSIAIIGSGISGLETAKNLIASEKLNVKIFEASNDFGGRIRKNESFCDYTLEMGGEELHGMNSEYYRTVIKNGGSAFEYWDLEKMYCYYKPAKDNPNNFDNEKVEAAAEINSKTSSSNINENNHLNSISSNNPNSNENDCDSDSFFPETHQLENMYEVTKKYPEMEFLNNLFEDISYETCLNDLPNISVKDYLIAHKIPKEAYFYADALIGSESGTDFSKVSVKGFATICEEWESGTQNLFLSNMSHYDVLKKNYAEILNKFTFNYSISEIKNPTNDFMNDNNFIQYNTQITKVDYTQKSKITLLDQLNNEYIFDLCVFCVPLPQYKKIKFLPELSNEKLNSLNRIGFDSTGKLFLKFSKRFWPEDAVVILVPGLANFFWPSNIGKNSKDFVLNCLIGGENCRTLSNLYKKDKKEFLEKLFEPLKVSFGKYVQDLLVDFIWFDWTEMPFIGGGYSYASVQENENDREVLAEPIENRIFFAGEAFAKNGHIATMHGAMESAIEISEYLINSFV